MNNSKLIWRAFLVSSVLAPAVPAAQVIEAPSTDSFLDSINVSADFGFNIGAKFSARQTLDGGQYNFLDGYVLPDSTGGFNRFNQTATPPVTQYWGVDNANQVNPASGFPQTVTLHSLADGGNGSSSFGDNPHAGIEFTGRRELGIYDGWHYGIEGGFSYMNLSLNNNTSASSGEAVTFSDNFTGNGASGNTLTGPYAGRYNAGQNPGPVIFQNPTGSTTVPLTFTEQDKLDADLWGIRLGPYLQHPLGKYAAINFSGGLAAVVVSANASWAQTLNVSGTVNSYSGSGSGTDVLWGYYLGADFAYHLTKRWDLTAGLRFQDVGTYNQNVGSRNVQLDMSDSMYITVGVSYRF